MDTSISIRCKESIKEAAKKAAKQESRSLANYIITLVKQDCEKKKIKMEE